MSIEMNPFDREAMNDCAQRWPDSSPLPSSLQEQIFVKTDSRFSEKLATVSYLSNNPKEEKVRKVFCSSPVGADLGGRADLILEWGGRDGPSWSASASATAKDDHGNGVEVRAQVHDDGSGKLAVSATHDSDRANKESNSDSRDK